MRHRFTAFLCSLAVLSAAPCAFAVPAGDAVNPPAANQPLHLDGLWFLQLMQGDDAFDSARVNLVQTGDRITGTLNELTVTGSLHGKNLELVVARRDGKPAGTIKGQLTGTEIKGALVLQL